jgi:NADPH:quinone reductase-like Zn-dependent oxidoreductase
MAYPEKIHAIGILETGDFDVIRDLEVAFPQPAPDQILLKVEYAGVNFVDTYFRYVSPSATAFHDSDSCNPRSGAFSPSKFPVLLGTEAAGEIVALPTDQKVLEDAEYKKRDFKVGDKVAVVRTILPSVIHFTDPRAEQHAQFREAHREQVDGRRAAPRGRLDARGRCRASSGPHRALVRDGGVPHQAG